MTTDVISISEAARRLRCTPREVYERIDRGELDAVKVDGLLHVTVPAGGPVASR